MTYRHEDPHEVIARLREELAEAQSQIAALRAKPYDLTVDGAEAVAAAFDAVDGPRVTKPAPAWFEKTCSECACDFRYGIKDVQGVGMLRRVACPGCGHGNYHTGVRHA